MKILKHVFKANDIRGLYPKELNKEFAYRLGKAFCYIYRPKSVIVSYDVRKGSLPMKKTLIKALVESGSDVVDIGLMPTDLFLFVCHKLRHPGIMVTASHNPAKYDGFKLENKDGTAIDLGNGLEKIEKAMVQNKEINSKKRGRVIKKDLRKDFLNFVFSFVKPIGIKKYKIILDPSNGLASVVGEQFIKKVKGNFVKFNWRKDGSFPGHGPNPLKKEVWGKVGAFVKKQKADLGIAFDSDGDRSFFFDEKGNFIKPEFVAAKIAEELLKKKKGKIVGDLTCSNYFKDTVLKSKGKYLRAKVGRAFMREFMKKRKALFGAESSGHCYFHKGDFYVDNSWVSVMFILKILSKSNKKLSELFADTKKYHISKPISLAVKSRPGALKKFKTHFKGKKLDFLDGITVIEKNQWFNLRPSNTEEIVRITIEANSTKLLKQTKRKLLRLLSNT